MNPFKEYAEEYIKRNFALSHKIQELLKVVYEKKQSIEAKKASYFKVASELDKAETTFKMLINSIEDGNLDFSSKIDSKSSKLL